MRMVDYMLTTFDNPFNPFDDFDRWYKEDILLGHNCCGLLGRTAFTSELFSDEVNEKNIDEAMKIIVQSDPMIFKLVTKEDYSTSI